MRARESEIEGARERVRGREIDREMEGGRAGHIHFMHIC